MAQPLAYARGSVRRRFRAASMRVAGLLLALAWAGAADLSFDLRDASGRRHTAAALEASKAVVFVFVGIDCPISNRYAPELAALHADYSSRGVRFYAVHSDPSITPAQAGKHAAEFGLPFPALLDPAQTLARQTGAAATPEAVVASPAGAALYRGRIDDRVVDFGHRRPQPTRHDLREAIEEILAGKPVSQAATKVVGCAIPVARVAAGARVTFARDVAPILHKHCAGCHRSDGAAPFPLVSYADAGRRAALIAAVTGSRYMPPWKPEPGHGDFRGARRLTGTETTALRQWAEAGAPEGDPAQLSPLPRPAAGLGPPDALAEMPQPFAVAAGGPDVYQCFVLPLGLGADRYVRAIDFQPRNRRLVHHALLFADPSGAARRRDAADPEVGYRCFGAPGFLPARGLGGWTPGAGPIDLPEDAPATLPKGADLVLQVHFHPTGKPETEQSRVALYFTDRPPRRRLVDIPLASNRIDIPPGERAWRVRDHFTLPIDVEAVGIIPHAHYICKEMKGVAVLPDGRRKPLLWIRDWDFNWQEHYRYASPVRLPAETRLEMEFLYDNSSDNPRNPSHPPRRVVWGPDLTDEMAGLHVQVLPMRMSEMPLLGEALRGKMMRMVGGGFFRPED